MNKSNVIYISDFKNKQNKSTDIKSINPRQDIFPKIYEVIQLATTNDFKVEDLKNKIDEIKERLILILKTATDNSHISSAWKYNVYVELGNLNFGKDNNKAEEFWNLAIKENPNKSEAYYNLGVLFFEQKQKHKSADFFKKSLAIKENKNVYYFLSELFKDSQDFFKFYRSKFESK